MNGSGGGGGSRDRKRSVWRMLKHEFHGMEQVLLSVFILSAIST